MMFEDHLLENYPLCGTPTVPLSIIGCYVIGVYAVGPWLMKSRPAYNPRSAMLWYNGLQVPFNLLMFIYVGLTTLFKVYIHLQFIIADSLFIRNILELFVPLN